MTYCCVIDLRKADDRVWRTGLWKRLWDEGKRRKMWRVLKDFYIHTQNCVLARSTKTDFIDVDVGVRQGCVLSPVLFSIYINGLAKEVASSSLGIDVDGKNVAILLYADDIVLIAGSIESLQSQIDITSI